MGESQSSEEREYFFTKQDTPEEYIMGGVIVPLAPAVTLAGNIKVQTNTRYFGSGGSAVIVSIPQRLLKTML